MSRSTRSFVWPYLVVVLASAVVACEAPRSVERVPDDDELMREFSGMVTSPALPKPDFTLTDTEGRPFDFREETRGHLTLLFFGYTHCPDVCPVHMANIAAAMRRLEPAIRDSIAVVFVTTDPERDTPDRLREWLANFDPGFVGLRGSRERVNEIQMSLGLPAAVKHDPEAMEHEGHMEHGAGADGDYLVGHSASVVAFTPDEVTRLRYPADTGPDEWANDLSKLVRARWASG